MELDIRASLRPMQRAMIDLRGQQVPFAASLALNNLAKGIAAQESDAISETFDRPTPFTKNAIRMQVANKSRLSAVVAIKDIQVNYLAPYVDGGDRFLGGKRGMLTPIAGNVPLNQYGNLSKGKLAALKAKPNVFIGPITFRKTGRAINGVWQRGATPRGARTKGGGEYGTKGKNTNVVDGVRTTLKLLIRFTDTTPTPKHLPFYERATAYVGKHAAGEFDDALRRAFATAKRN